MSISTAKQFVAVLQKSRLLKPKHLHVVRSAAEKDPDPKALAGRLVKKQLISRWQAKQLLAGHVSFFLGEYRLIEPLSAHSGSHVYLAEHKTLGRRVVLKRLPRDVMAHADRKKRLLGAVRAAVGFEHANLARVYSIEQAGDRYYVISQYVEGRDLAAAVAETGPLAFAEAAAVASQAASGLAEVHRRKAVHGGVRPSNLVTGPDGLVKLVAVATARRHEGKADTDEDRPAVLDAANYQAPELLKADVDPTPASDIYSLGCTLFFFLTGKPPFDEGTAAERAAAHARHQPPGILRLRPDTPESLVKACRKMLAKRPEDRPGSAEEIVEMLAELCPPERSATRVVAPVSARVPEKEAATSEGEKEEAPAGERADASRPADEAAASAAGQEAASDPAASDAAADGPEEKEPSSEAGKKADELRPEAKTPERRRPAKAPPAAAKPAPKRPPPRSAAGDREGKTPGKKKPESPAPKSEAALAVDTGDTDSPVARAKSRAGKPAAASGDDDTVVTTDGPEGFLKKHRKWVFIGGGSAAALLLAVAITLVMALAGSSSKQAVTQTARAGDAESEEAQPRKAEETVSDDLLEDLDLEAGLDLDMDLGIDDAPVRRSRDTEPDEKPETPAEDEKATEDEESAQRDDAEPADADKEPDAPKEDSEEEEEPEKEEEPEEKEAEKAKPPEEEKEKPPTFRDFPETVELPSPVADDGQSARTEPFTLGKLHVRERAPWIVVLSGGDVVVPNAEIEMSRGTVEGGSRAYIVQMTEGGESTAIGRLWFEPGPGELKFQWLEAAAETQGAGLLRLCQVNLTIDGEPKTLALSKPAPAPPLEFDLEKKVDRVTIESDSLPDDKLLRLEITGIEGVDPKGYPFQTKPDGPIEVKKPLALALQRMDRDRNPQMIALLRLTLNTTRKGLTIQRQIEHPQRVALPKPPQLLRQEGEKAFKDSMAKLKKAQGSRERDAVRPELDKIEYGLGLLDVIEVLDKQAKIHYRILLQAGNHRIPLFDSEVAGP